MGRTSDHRAAGRALAALAAIAAAAIVWSAPAQAGFTLPYRVLHEFCKANCRDGSFPAGERLVRDVSGKLFGTTFRGGDNNGGMIYEAFPKHGGTRYFKKVLARFCHQSPACVAGGKTQSGVIMDTAGNLYGTTPAGATPCGTIYEAVLSGGTYKLKRLHAFASTGGDACNASSAALAYHGKESGQLYDGTSPLFGVTFQGGANGEGAVFMLAPPKPGHTGWKETVIYSYCPVAGCADGQNPTGNVVVDSSDNLYTTAASQVLELVPDGSGGFTRQPVYQSTTGELFNFLTIASDGTLYGVSGAGGPKNHGTLFKLVPDGSGGFTYTDLHDFCDGGGQCLDGDLAVSVLVDSSGTIWGTTLAGGDNAAPKGSPFLGAGVVFDYSSAGFSNAHHFCSLANCADGGTPTGGLVTDGAGNFFGVAAFGGATPSAPRDGRAPGLPPGGGVLYEISVP